MTTSADSTTPSPQFDQAPELDDRSPVRRRVAMWLTLLAVLALTAGWVYILFIYDPGLMIDELEDRTFPTAAEQVCAVAVEQLDALPPANLADTADERADTVEQTNVILTQMVVDLRPLAPTAPTVDPDASARTRAELEAKTRIAKGVNEWLDDWETYIEDRREYAANLRTDDEARFLETAKGSDTKGITRAINSFAQVNRMGSCSTPADLS